MAFANYEPRGMEFYSNGKMMMLVSDDEPRESLRGWLVYKHPDGQWVTLRKATEADLAALHVAKRRGFGAFFAADARRTQNRRP